MSQFGCNAVASAARVAMSVALAVAAAIGGCALPAEQLGLPGRIEGPSKGSAIGSAARRGGVAMSGGGEAGDLAPRAQQGTGEFTGRGVAGGPIGGSGAGQAAGAPAAQVTAVGDGVRLNLAGATIQAAAKSVLGDTLGLNYSVNQAVQGTITINVSRPIAKADLYNVFETLIRSEGAVIIVENGIHKIVPDSAAPTGLRRRPGSDSGAGLTSEIVALRFISPEEMARILKALAPQSSVVRVDSNRNLLIVRGTASELASIGDTVQTFDVDWMRGMSVGVYPVEAGDPEAIAQELDTIFGTDKASPVQGVIRFVPNRRLKSLLVITSRPAYLQKAATWIRRMETVGRAHAKQVHVYHVQTRPATELSQLLQQVYKPAGDGRGQQSPAPGGSAELPTVGAGAGSAGPPGLAPAGGGAVAGSAGPVPQPLPVNPLGAALAPSAPVGSSGQADAATPASGIVTGSLQQPRMAAVAVDDRGAGIQIIPDDANNSLIITASISEYRRIRQILSRLDVAPNQVLLEATIAEIALNDQLKFGLRWFFAKRRNQVAFTDSAVGAVASRFPGFSYFLNLPNVQVALNALADVTDVNIVSSPSLMVLDNKQAVLQVGDEVPVATQSAVSVISPGAPIVNSVTFRSTGVILRIRPRIGDNGRVVLEIEQEVSDVVPTTSSSIDSPTIQQRRIKTTVAVDSGQSIVLAGFMQDRAARRRQQVPLVGNIPVLGNLFKDKDDQIRRTELLIAITPNIVKDPHQIRGIAAEFRDRLNFTTRPQRRAPPDRREQWDRTFVR